MSTRSSRRLRRAGLAIAAVMVIGALAACGAGPTPPADATQDPAAATATTEPTPAPTLTAEELQLQQRFRAAVVDAETAEPAEISDELTVIDPSNQELVWQQETGRVLVATWTSWDGYDAQVGKELALQREVWVTAVPEMRDFCQDYQPDDVPLTLRLEQLLGLPPKNGKTRVVQFWVPTDGLFPPSPDPEITDSVAQLEMPPASAFPSQKDYEFSRDWFNLQRSLSYDEKNGYPWTRLGYTYDWGDPDSEVGLSEFVIWAGTTVAVDSVAPTEAYCAK